MANKPDNPFKFWEELKRRKVVRVIIGYLASSYVILELTSIVAEPWGLPDWTINFVSILLIIGFFVTVIISWIFDVTPDGIKKTESAKVIKLKETISAPVKRKLRVSDVIIGILLVVVLILVYPKIFNKDKFRGIRDEDGRISVAVMPIRNLTNDTLFNFYQEAIQDELINDLTSSKELNVRQFSTVYGFIQSKGNVEYASLSPEVGLNISKQLNAKVTIIGSIVPARDNYRLNIQLINTETQDAIESFQVEGDDLIEMEDSISVLLMDYLITMVLGEGIDHDVRTMITTQNSEAYRYYIEGIKHSFNNKFLYAISSFEKSIKHDSTFAVALFGLSVTNYELGNKFKADSIFNIAYQYIDNLPEYHRITMEGFKLRLEKDLYGGINYYHQLIELDPESRVTWNFLGDAYLRVQNYEKCIEAYERYIELDNKWGPWGKFFWPYVELGLAYHELGNHDRENELYEMAYKISSDPVITQYQLMCSLSQGNISSSNKYKNQLITILKESGVYTEDLLNSGLGDLYSYAGIQDSAEYYLRWSFDLNPQSYSSKRDLATFLVTNDINSSESIELINDLYTNHSNWFTRYLKGLSLHLNSNEEEALELLKESWDERPKYDHDHFLKIKEVEQALAKQNREQ